MLLTPELGIQKPMDYFLLVVFVPHVLVLECSEIVQIEVLVIVCQFQYFDPQHFQRIHWLIRLHLDPGQHLHSCERLEDGVYSLVL